MKTEQTRFYQLSGKKAYRDTNHYRYKGPKYLPVEWEVTDPDTDVDAILPVINLISDIGKFDPGMN